MGTGIYLAGGLNITVNGVRAAQFTLNQDLAVFGGSIGDKVGGGGSINVVDDLTAGRVEAGHGNFYAGLFIRDGKGNNMGLAFKNYPGLGIRALNSTVIQFCSGGATKMQMSGTDTRFFRQLSLADGTSSAPSIRWAGDTNTGIYQDSDVDTIKFTTGATQCGYFDANQDFFVPNGGITSESFTLLTQQTYTPSNVSTVRSYDADATSTAELADVLGTLIADLQTAGLLA